MTLNHSYPLPGSTSYFRLFCSTQKFRFHSQWQAATWSYSAGSATTCSSCTSNKVLDTSLCVDSCPDGKFDLRGKCQACSWIAWGGWIFWGLDGGMIGETADCDLAKLVARSALSNQERQRPLSATSWNIASKSKQVVFSSCCLFVSSLLSLKTISLCHFLHRQYSTKYTRNFW